MTSGLPPSTAFSQVVVSTGTKIIHCAGQTAWDKDMNIVGGDDLEQQTAQALENIKSALAAAGATMQDVVRLDVYVVDYDSDKISRHRRGHEPLFRPGAPAGQHPAGHRGPGHAGVPGRDYRNRSGQCLT